MRGRTQWPIMPPPRARWHELSVHRHRRRCEPRRAQGGAQGRPDLCEQWAAAWLELDGKHPGAVIARTASGKLHYRVALRSPVAVDHLELVQMAEW